MSMVRSELRDGSGVQKLTLLSENVASLKSQAWLVFFETSVAKPGSNPATISTTFTINYNRYTFKQ